MAKCKGCKIKLPSRDDCFYCRGEPLEDNYVQYGDEWEKEMMNLSKKTLINMIRKIKTNT